MRQGAGVPQCPRHPRFLSRQAISPLPSALPAPQGRPRERLLWGRHQTSWGRGRGGQDRSPSPSPLQSGHCMRPTLAGCARGGGRGQPEFADRSVTSSTELHTPPAAEAAPPLQCPGQKGPQRPVHPAGRGPDQGSAPVRQDSRGKRAIRQSPSGLPPTAAFTDRQVLSVQPLTDPPKLFPFVLRK